MAGMLDQLITVLEAELLNYEQLLQLSITKTEAIVNDNIKVIKDITNQENLLLGKNQTLEKKRQTLISDIAIVLNRDKNTLTLTNLIDILANSPKEQSKLKFIRDKLEDIINKLKSSNNQNGELINQALEFINFNINAVQSMQSLPPVSYDYDGKQHQTEGRNFFDAKQ